MSDQWVDVCARAAFLVQSQVTRALSRKTKRGSASVARAVSLLQRAHQRRAEHRDLAGLISATLSLPPEHGGWCGMHASRPDAPLPAT